MEHHFLPFTPTPHDICVPYVCDPAQDGVFKPYDGEDFLTYPSRLGKDWLLPTADQNQLKTESFLDRRRYFKSTVEQEKIIQSWIFFGLLATFLRAAYNAKDYIEERDDGPVTTTKVLTKRMAEAWQNRAANASAEEREAQFLRAVRCLRVSSDVLQSCREDFDWRIKLSITSVIELFGRAMNQSYAMAGNTQERLAPGILFPAFPNEPIRDQMLAAGWCPAEVSAISARFTSLQTMYFLSRVDKRAGGRSHASCTDGLCVAYQIDRESYRTAHTTEGCTCAPLPVDIGAICAILDTHALPVLEVSGLRTDAPRVRVVASSESRSFVALSHVWADGLGNPERNELPTCQVLAVGHMVAALPEQADAAEQPAGGTGGAPDTVHIWIDTVCCPIVPDAAKTRSILRMRETYSSAARVLVLDKGLRAQRSRPRHPAENVLAVFTAAWMQRLWTLQEGALPPSLWVQFADGALDLDATYRALWALRLTDARLMCLVDDISAAWRAMRRQHHPGLLSPDADLGRSLLELDQALLHRSVSYPADEALCVATLLDLPADAALAGADPSVEARMAALWRALAAARGGLPQKLILLNYPRMATRGFRWAPRTLLQPGPGARILQWRDPVFGALTPRGFEVSYAAVRLRLAPRPGALAEVAARYTSAKLNAGVSFRVAGERCLMYVNEALIYARSAFDGFPEHASLVGADLAVLLVHQVGATGPDGAGIGVWLGLLVRVDEDEGRHVAPQVEILCPVAFNGASALFEPCYDAADEVAARAAAEADAPADVPGARELLQRHARRVLAERPAARAALERLDDSDDGERLAQLLAFIAGAGMRFDVARAERVEGVWCVT